MQTLEAQDGSTSSKPEQSPLTLLPRSCPADDSCSELLLFTDTVPLMKNCSSGGFIMMFYFMFITVVLLESQVQV